MISSVWNWLIKAELVQSLGQILLFAVRIQLLKKAIRRVKEEPSLSRCWRSLRPSAEMPCPVVLPKSIIAPFSNSQFKIRLLFFQQVFMSTYCVPTTVSVLGTLWWARETSSHLHESYAFALPLGSLGHPPLIRATSVPLPFGLLWHHVTHLGQPLSCCIFIVCCVAFPFETWITSRTVTKISFLCTRYT